jgi:hypothetical protein
MREQDHPAVTNELVEVDRAVGRLRVEVRGGGSKTETVRTKLVDCSWGEDIN